MQPFVLKYISYVRYYVWHRGVKKFGQLALVEPNDVFLHQQVYAGAAVFCLVNQDFGHGFSLVFWGAGYLKIGLCHIHQSVLALQKVSPLMVTLVFR